MDIKCSEMLTERAARLFSIQFNTDVDAERFINKLEKLICSSTKNNPFTKPAEVQCSTELIVACVKPSIQKSYKNQQSQEDVSTFLSNAHYFNIVTNRVEELLSKQHFKIKELQSEKRFLYREIDSLKAKIRSHVKEVPGRSKDK